MVFFRELLVIQTVAQKWASGRGVSYDHRKDQVAEAEVEELPRPRTEFFCFLLCPPTDKGGRGFSDRAKARVTIKPGRASRD